MVSALWIIVHAMNQKLARTWFDVELYFDKNLANMAPGSLDSAYIIRYVFYKLPVIINDSVTGTELTYILTK